MPLNFPTNPTTNQTYTYNSVTWTWTGSRWEVAGGAGSGVAAVYDIASTSTGYFDLPSGNTAQRPGSPDTGMIRYNSTTGFAEVYTSVGWGSFGAQPPSISTVTPATYNGEAGTTFTINGANFTADAVVKFIDVNGTEYTAGAVTFVDQSQLTATTPQDFTVAQEPLDVKVVQTSGQVTKVDCIDCGGTPTWSTAAGTIATIFDSSRAGANVALVATDPDINATITYSITSGSLPSGLTLNSSSGYITGNAAAVASDTTYTFTVNATDNANNSSSRQFSIIVKAPVITAFTYTGANQTFTKPAGVSKINVYMWGAAGGGSNAEGYSDAGGPGGYASGTIDITPFASLIVQVGAGGGRTDGGTTKPARPYPYGGLPEVRSGYTSGAGGGRSAIFTSSVVAANALLIAGGGGGAGGHGGGGGYAGCNMGGGSGGGTNGIGGSGYSNCNATLTNFGTQSSSNGSSGSQGAQLQGGDANTGNAAGGGGDGWYGGGGLDAHNGGGGGSGYFNPAYVTNNTFESTAFTTGKKATVNPAQTGSTYYAAGIAVGTANGNGGNGRVVIVY